MAYRCALRSTGWSLVTFIDSMFSQYWLVHPGGLSAQLTACLAMAAYLYTAYHLWPSLAS